MNDFDRMAEMINDYRPTHICFGSDIDWTSVCHHVPDYSKQIAEARTKLIKNVTYGIIGVDGSSQIDKQRNSK